MSLELSHSTWLLTALSSGGTKMSKYSSPTGDGPALLSLLSRLWAKAAQPGSGSISVVVIENTRVVGDAGALQRGDNESGLLNGGLNPLEDDLIPVGFREYGAIHAQVARVRGDVCNA